MHLTPDVIASLPCDVQLPDSWQAGGRPDGGFVAVHHESRRFHRWPFQSIAALECCRAFPCMCRPMGWHRVYTLTLSRGGISFLHGEQLFPREIARVFLLNGKDLEIEVVRCRRIQDSCYEIGARFVEVA